MGWLLSAGATSSGLLGLFLSADLLALDLEVLPKLASDTLFGLEAELRV